MTDFTYTKAYGVVSKAVDDVYYNANEGYVVIDLNDEMYRYDNVSRADVENLVNAASVGNYYNTFFKHKFGPATHLGNWKYVDFDVVDEVSDSKIKTGVLSGTLVAKDFNSTPVTKEFSLQTPQVSDSFEDGEVDVVSTVYFTLDGYGTVYEFVSNKQGVDEAIAELNDYVSRVGAKGKVVKVVFEFE